MKILVTLIVALTLVLGQPVLASCSYINCYNGDSTTCACGLDCIGSASFCGFYKWCASGSGAYSICINSPKKVGWTAPCEKVYNWSTIAACAAGAGNGGMSCAKCIASEGTDLWDCGKCITALLALPKACPFCSMVTCSPGNQTAAIRSALDTLKEGGECHGGPSICDQ